MKYVEVKNGIVVSLSDGQLKGFVEAPEDVACGMQLNQDDSYSYPAEFISKFRDEALEKIDTAAEKARKRYITAGEGQAMVYQQKVSEAESYKAAVSPVDTDYPLLKAEADALKTSVSVTADTVLSTRDQWLMVAAQIEAIRLAGKETVRGTSSVAEIKSIPDTLIWP